VLPGDEAPTAPTAPWVALLPALDSTAMGWADRAWFLGDKEQQAPYFDRSGNVGPTIWSDGQVVGAWGQRKDGEIAIGLRRDVGTDARMAIGEEADRLSQVIGAVRVTPRFRTPLERELAG
jgi:hypothetical protein